MLSLVTLVRSGTRLGGKIGPVGPIGAVRTAVYNNYEHKPGPFPPDDGARKAAAARYGMDPEVYRPYPDDGMGFGDYPDLPMVSMEARSDYYPWDNVDAKRNFDEPVHALAVNLDATRLNVNHRYAVPMRKQLVTFLSTIFGAYAVYFFLEDYKYFPVVGVKQFPADGAHYSFPGDARH